MERLVICAGAYVEYAENTRRFAYIVLVF